MASFNSTSVGHWSEFWAPTRFFVVRAPGHKPILYHYALVASTNLRDAAARVILKKHHYSLPPIEDWSDYFCDECAQRLLSILSSSDSKRARRRQEELFRNIRDDLIVSVNLYSPYKYHVRSCCIEVDVFDSLDVFLASKPCATPGDRASRETRLRTAWELSQINPSILRDIVAGFEAVPTSEILPPAFLLAVEIARPQLCDSSWRGELQTAAGNLISARAAGRSQLAGKEELK